MCTQCGAAQDPCGPKVLGSLAGLVKLALWGSAALLAASPFLENGPNWKLCLLVTGALFFLNRSLDDPHFRRRR